MTDRIEKVLKKKNETKKEKMKWPTTFRLPLSTPWKRSFRCNITCNSRISFCLFFFPIRITTHCEIVTSSIDLIPVLFPLFLSLCFFFHYFWPCFSIEFNATRNLWWLVIYIFSLIRHVKYFQKLWKRISFHFFRV